MFPSHNLRSGEVHVFVYRQLIFFPKKDINFIVKTFKIKLINCLGLGRFWWIRRETANQKIWMYP
jgi:hypothetical protein